MSIDGTIKFSTLVVKEITADISSNGVVLSAKAAFVDRSTGATHGWTKGEGAIWSKETKELALSLQQSMEMDMAALHFHAGSFAPNETTATHTPRAPVLSGIGEFLKEEADQA